jgi:hypothetical protein
MFGHHKEIARPAFTSQIFSRRYKLIVKDDVVWATMGVMNGCIDIQVFDPTITPDSFTDEQVESFLNGMREMLSSAQKEVVLA